MLLQAALKVTFTKKKPVIERPRAPAAAAQIDGAVIGRMRQRAATAAATPRGPILCNQVAALSLFLTLACHFPQRKSWCLFSFISFSFFASLRRRLKHPKWTVSWGLIYENLEI